ncbi:MAG: Hsp70 family protein [Deltaproteobacteria bacterium]|nr:Hsp70 family protein [Deltaproteobacteria bacterium]
MNELVVGIDLGTTNSLVGAVVEGKARLFSDLEGRELLPSAVSMNDAGRLIVGRAARNRRLLDPAGTVLSIKRKMGEPTKVKVGKSELAPAEVSAVILGTLLDWTESQTGQRPKRAVITVPAYFGEAQRQATRDAGEMAGLVVERLVNEPTAAALTYQTGQEETVLVYDFGGGTFDVSVLERDQGFLEVRASRGDTHLGGDDIDQAIVELLLGRLGERRKIVERDPRAMVRLLDAAERAKIALSSREEVELVEPYLAGQGADSVHLELSLTRAEAAQVARPFVERTLAAVDQALKDAKLSPRALDRVLLVGGSSRIPLVAELVSERLARPAYAELDADRAVALGASLLAGRTAGAQVDEVLVDITPRAIAVGAIDRRFEYTGRDDDLIACPVIPKDSVVPVERSQVLWTVQDGQRAVAVPVVQGEALRVRDNLRLGVVEISELPPSPGGSAVDLKMRLDLSGILHVSATHRPSGKQVTVEISHSPYRLSELRRAESKATVEALRRGRAEDEFAAPEGSPTGPELDEPVEDEGELVEAVGGASLEGTDSDDDADRRLALALIARANRALETAADESSVRTVVASRVAELKASLESGKGLDERLEALTDALLDL